MTVAPSCAVKWPEDVKTRSAVLEFWRTESFLVIGIALGLLSVMLLPSDWTRLVTLVWLAPLCEEIILRTGFQGWLLERGVRPLASVVVTAALFAGMHLWAHPVPMAIATAVPALVIGLVYLRRQSILTCVALHSTFNVAWLVVNPLLAGHALFV